ncbi:MAG TPA: hypothetical protein VII33_14555, partial [Nakamurella sp.]
MSSEVEGHLAHARAAGDAAPDLVVPRDDVGPAPKHLASLLTVNPAQPPPAEQPHAQSAPAEPAPVPETTAVEQPGAAVVATAVAEPEPSQ